MTALKFIILAILIIILTGFILLFTNWGNNMIVSLLPRPQTPKERPYIIREVSFPGAVDADNEVTLAGELTMPYQGAPFPAVILIAGSGPYDRDENISRHKFLLVFSDYLTKNGYAVLRYDKRGIGQSTGDFQRSTIKDFSADAAAAKRWLAKDKHIDATRIGYAGHSSGGYIAPLAAREEGAAFLVLLAGPAEDLGATLLRQNLDIAKARGKDDAWISLNQKWIAEFIDIFRSVQDPDEGYRLVNAAFARYEKGLELPAKELNDFLAAVPPAWWMWVLNYDPLPVIKAYDGPVFAAFGSRDLQVSASHNALLMKKLLAHKKSRINVFQDLNHLFQPSKNGLPEDYVWIDTTFDETAMETITNWINLVIGDPQQN